MPNPASPISAGQPGPSTRSVHAAETRRKAAHALVEPVFHTSTYTFERMADVIAFEEAHADGGHGLRVVREVEIVTTDGRGRFLKIVLAYAHGWGYSLGHGNEQRRTHEPNQCLQLLWDSL